MFGRNKKAKQVNINDQEIAAFIGLGYEIIGDVSGKSIIRIDGTVHGNVTVEGGVILGDKGIILGNITTKVAVLHGKVKGNVTTTQLEIKASGKVNGDIKTDILQIEIGAQYNGSLEMKEMIKTEELEVQVS